MRLKEWPSGTPVTVFVLPDENPVHQDFIENLLQMMPYQLRRYWDRSTYTGFGQPPIEVATIEEMLERVKETPGAIGYIDTARDTEHVAIIAIH